MKPAVDASALAGIQFPGQDNTAAPRSSTAAGAHIVASAMAQLDPAKAQAVSSERHWRRNYPAHFRAMTELALPSAQLAINSASAGLQAAWQTMVWHQDGRDVSLEQAKSSASPIQPLKTHVVNGQADATSTPWSVPYQGQVLTGDALRQQIDRWQAQGIIEPSAAAALQRCAQNPEWFDLSDRHLVLLGAGSEAGPLRWLARWRAQIVGVDINRPAVWQRIAGIVQAGNGTLYAPVLACAEHANISRNDNTWVNHAGANLLTNTPALAQWVSQFAREHGGVDVAAHAYLDGERHVRVSMAMDWIARAACEAHTHTTLAYMATPTDVFAVPEATAVAAQQAYGQRPVTSRALQTPLHLATGDRYFQPNVEGLVNGPEGKRYGIVDSLVIEQGPNYALAKRMQQWRAMVARAQGHRVSLNIAPSTTTASVVKNPALAAGFAGASSFGIEVFEPETTNALMAALWVHDLRSDEGATCPTTPLAHPFELFMDNACHGGLWSTGYLPRSALPFAAALGWARSRLKMS